MINVIVELSKYIILTLMIVYTFHCFYTVRQSDEEDSQRIAPATAFAEFFSLISLHFLFSILKHSILR